MKHASKTLQTLNLSLFVILCVILFVGEGAVAQSTQYKRKSSAKSKKAATAKKASKNGKLDISGLEQKYWAPKDTDFSVVQNRTFTKANKYVVSLQYGMPVNDPYNDGNATTLTGNYFFNERHGVQVSYSKFNLSDSNLIDAFLGIPGNVSTLKPDFGRVNSQIQVGYTWVPIYAKVSMLGKKIIYLDMAITPHIGTTSYKQLYRAGTNPNYYEASQDQSAFSYGFDITQYFFFSKWLAVRADLRNTFYTEDVLFYTQGTPAVRRSKTTNTTLFTVGASFYFSL